MALRSANKKPGIAAGLVSSQVAIVSDKARVFAKDGQIKVPVKRLLPEKYRLEWYATLPDKQHAQGSYNFFVGIKEERKQGSRHVPRNRH